MRNITAEYLIIDSFIIMRMTESVALFTNLLDGCCLGSLSTIKHPNELLQTTNAVTPNSLHYRYHTGAADIDQPTDTLRKHNPCPLQ